jgi:hypothetical protein
MDDGAGEGDAHTDYGSAMEAESDFVTDEEDPLGESLQPASFIADVQQHASAQVFVPPTWSGAALFTVQSPEPSSNCATRLQVVIAILLSVRHLSVRSGPLRSAGLSVTCDGVQGVQPYQLLRQARQRARQERHHLAAHGAIAAGPADEGAAAMEAGGPGEEYPSMDDRRGARKRQGYGSASHPPSPLQPPAGAAGPPAHAPRPCCRLPPLPACAHSCACALRSALRMSTATLFKFACYNNIEHDCVSGAGGARGGGSRRTSAVACCRRRAQSS